VIGSLVRVGAFAATLLPRRWTVEQPRANADRPTGQAAAGSEGAPRRTSLAAERTYLAWLRTGLGAIGVALAVGRLIPALISGSRVAYAALGAGYGVLGAFIIAYAVVRVRQINAALEAGGPVAPDWWAVIVITAMSLALALATIVMVLVSV